MNSEFVKYVNDFLSRGGHRKNMHYNITIELNNPEK